MLAQALEQARDMLIAELDAAWGQTGHTEYYEHLLADIERHVASSSLLRRRIRHAHASVPTAHFIVGVTPPGQHPAMESAIRRAAAIRRAILGVSLEAAHSVELTLQVARAAGLTATALETGRDLQQAGQTIFKRWITRQDGRVCMWCRFLHDTVVPLDADFPLPHPVALEHQVTRRVRTPAGQRKFHQAIGTRIIWTHPPKLYHGMLPGPPLHPRCRCRVVIVVGGGQETTAPVPPAHRGASAHLAASDIRAMPENRYHALLAFITAAAHELGQVLRRLAHLGG
jgi:hypothetical protein